MKRDHDLDFVKGLAVIAMSFVHVNIFFLAQKSPVLDSITKWGAISCFSTFLLISGILGGMVLKRNSKPSWNKTVQRMFFIYIAYLIIGLLSWYVTHGSLNIVDIDNILILRELPLLSEYLITFILLSLFFQLAYKPLIKISKSPILILILSVVVFLLGQALFNMEFLDSFWIKGIFVGIGDYHYFPLLQYLPIYLLGIYLGRNIKLKYYIFTFLGVLLLYISFNIFKVSNWTRFPPSAYFLIESLLIPTSILAVLKGIKEDIVIHPIEIFAKNSLLSLALLTVITLLSALLLSSNLTISCVWALNLGILLLTALILALYFKVKKMV